MISAVRTLGLAAALGLGVGTLANAQETSKNRQGGQTPPQSKASSGSAAAPKGVPDGDVTLATVNGEPITKSEVINWLARFEIVPGSESRAYDAAMDMLVKGKLLEQFLRRNRVPVSPADVDRYVERFGQSMKQEGSSIENYLAMTATTPDQFKKMATAFAQWENYLLTEGRDATLKKYLQDNMDVFSRAEVKASHILVKVDPKASAEEKEKARQKLLAIKKEIQSGKLTFADAANKYSEDDGNHEQPSGGNLGFFPRKGVFIEPFAKAAFAMKEGEISDPVETEYGLHLIHVTQKKPGEAVAFNDEVKPLVMSVFADELEEKIVENERKTAKIDIKPMPGDLFRLLPQAPAGDPAPSAASKAATTKATSKGAATK